jgi:hypothetical protein
MHRFLRHRERSIAAAAAALAVGSALGWLLGGGPLALALGLAASGWTLAARELRAPAADLHVSVLMDTRQREELVAVRAVSVGRVPVTVASVAFLTGRGATDGWGPAWHPLHSELPGRPLHRGYGATFAVAARSLAEATDDPTWVRLRDTAGVTYEAPVPYGVRDRLASIRDTSGALGRYRVAHLEAETLVPEAATATA